MATAELDRGAMADEELIADLQEGDTSAMGRIFDRYNAQIFSCCLKILCDTHLAEDAMQETFRLVLENCHKYNTNNFRAWIHKIAIRKSLNMRRGIGRRPEIILSHVLEPRNKDERLDSSLLADPRQSASIDEALYRESVAMFIARYNSLNERQQIAFSLHHLEERSYTEAAKTMEITMSAYRSLLKRAMDNLISR